ncbi:MAG TPA: YbaY family lipoprotein [Variovorax sp.]|nr:YbaY family lipoprotein [Variovorax sp.]
MKARRIAFALLALGAAALLAACTMPGQPAQGAQPLRVSGTVAWRERMALPPDAQIIVRLQDVSRMDVPAVTLAEQRIAAQGRQPPFAFELSVDPARIDPRMRYTVSARVEHLGQLLFINNTAYPVLTQGAGPSAQLMLVRTGPR